jgi:hypothetical protein
VGEKQLAILVHHIMRDNRGVEVKLYVLASGWLQFADVYQTVSFRKEKESPSR